jgi:hypothetical protein
MDNDARTFAGLLMPKDEQSMISLPAYKNTELDYVVGDEFGASVIWIKDAHIYSFHGQASLSFVFATLRSTTRFTARILDRPTIQDHNDGIIFMFRVKMLVNVGARKVTLELLLCETPLMDAPAIISRNDAELFA